MRRWYDYKGQIVELGEDVRLTMYDGLNHQIVLWPDHTIGQMITKCGRRACPHPQLREVPGRGPVDCAECTAALLAEPEVAAVAIPRRHPSRPGDALRLMNGWPPPWAPGVIGPIPPFRPRVVSV